MFKSKKLPIVYQSEVSTCGLACLSMIASYYGHQISVAELKRIYNLSLKGLKLNDIMGLAHKINLSCRAIKCEPEQLKHLKVPAMLHWDMDHFVVLKRVTRKYVELHDPAVGFVKLNYSELSDHFTGVAVEISPEAAFETRRSKDKPLGLIEFARRSQGILGKLASVIWLTGFLELFAIFTPLFLKLVIDHGIQNYDPSFIQVMSTGLIFVAVLHALTTYFRDQSSMRFGSAFNHQVMRSIFSHMLKLPYSYFESRQVGELVDRVQVTANIRQVVNNNIAGSIFDGILALISLSLIFYASSVIGLVCSVVFLFHLSINLGLINRIRVALTELHMAKSKENGFLIESIQAILSIKIFAKESQRENVWNNYYAEYVNKEEKLTSLKNIKSASQVFLMAIESAIILLIAGSMIAEGLLSLGTFFAIFMFKAHFTIKSTAFIDKLMEIRMMRVYLNRIADIITSPVESDELIKLEELQSCKNIKGHLTFSGVSFQYAPNTPWLVNKANLDIKAGEFVAIMGVSGIGKTTLLKMLLRLIEPQEGQVLLDGKNILNFPVQEYRTMFGAVLQDSSMLSGSILEIISFHDTNPDIDKIVSCAKLAGIDQEIEAMPMRYDTRVGDISESLSSGQKQRMLLARALYQEPKILLIDEATANLDRENEEKILEHICNLSITRICVTHKPETAAKADRIINLEAGKLAYVS